MDQLTTFGIAFLIIITLGVLIWRAGRGDGGRRWALGWFCLCLGGACAIAAPDVPFLGPFYPTLGTAFAALLYSGVLGYLGREMPPRLIASAVVVAAVRGIAQPFVSETVTLLKAAARTLGEPD